MQNEDRVKRECRQCTRHLFYTYSKRKGRSGLLGRRASFSLVAMASRTLKDSEITNELMVREKFTKLFKNCVLALSQLHLHGSGSSGHSSVTDIQLFVHAQELYTLEATSRKTSHPDQGSCKSCQRALPQKTKLCSWQAHPQRMRLLWSSVGCRL